MIHNAQAVARMQRDTRFIRTESGLLVPSIMGGATGVSFSDFLENEVLDHLLSAATYTAPGTTHIALYTVAPTDAGGGTEVTGGSYARVAYTNTVANWPAAVGGAKSNANLIDFGTATANWGTVVAMSIMDAGAAGNMLFYGNLAVSKTVNNGDGFRFLATHLNVALD